MLWRARSSDADVSVVAVGAAIAQVSGEVSHVVKLGEGLDRAAAIAEATEAATDIAVTRGAGQHYHAQRYRYTAGLSARGYAFHPCCGGG